MWKNANVCAIVILFAVLRRTGKYMGKRGKIFFYSFLCVAFFVMGICFLTNLTDPKYGYGRHSEFMKYSEKCEVLFFGNSHMGCAAYPMELWRDWGITSFNMAGAGNPMPSSYWMMKNALHNASPKVIVIDCYRLRYNTMIDVNKGTLHTQTDPLPLTADKMRMICDLLESPNDRLEFAWSFAVYHERWQELNRIDFEPEIGVAKSRYTGFYDVAPPIEMAERPAETVAFTSKGTEYLRRMIEECQSRGIEVLLVYLPFPALEEEWQEALCMEQIAEEYGISSINFLELQIADLGTDCYDENSHLNGSGGRKVTEYLGQYLVEHYDLEDHRGEAEYADWDEDYRQYTDNKLETLEQLESLDNTLVMLADQSFDCCIYVNGNADLWRQNEMYLPLVENIAGGKTEKLRQAAAEGRDYLLVVDNQDGVFESVDRGQFSRACSLGQLSFDVDENGKGRLRLRDKQERKLPESSQPGAEAVRIFVMDNQGDGTVWTKSFAAEETIKVTR